MLDQNVQDEILYWQMGTVAIKKVLKNMDRLQLLWLLLSIMAVSKSLFTFNYGRPIRINL